MTLRSDTAAQLLEKHTARLTERDALLNNVEEFSERILQLNGQIFQLRSEYNSVLPILSLPHEISMIIFSLACQPSRVFLRSKVIDGAEEGRVHTIEEGQEVAISHVCHAWRVLSLGYPELWSSFNYFPKYAQEHSMYRFATYLERARPKLLHFWAYIHSLDDFKLILKMLEVHNLRLRRLSLTLENGLKCSSALTPKKPGYGDAPLGSDMVPYCNLETLDIYQPGGVNINSAGFNASVAYAISDAITAPNIVSLRIDHQLLAASWAPRPYQNSLSILHLDSGRNTRLPWTAFLTILSDFPNLTALTVSHTFDAPVIDSLDDNQIKATIAPNLRYFRCADNKVWQWMWLYLQAPKLELLTLKSLLMCDMKIPRTGLGNIRVEPFPSLQTLSFIFCAFEFTNEDMMSALAYFTQSITQLVISATFFTGGITESKTPLWFMAQLEPRAPAWPHLEAVSVWHVVKGPWADTHCIPVFLKLIAARKRFLDISCKLRMLNDLARQWQAREPTLWNYIEAEELFERIPAGCPEDWFPWPAQETSDFHWTAKTSF